MVLSQFCSDDAVNGLFNYSKKVVDQICVNDERPRELRTIQYLIFAGMISYYGFEHIKAITIAFRKNKFFYTKEAMADFLAQQKDISQETLDVLDKDDTCAYFYQNYFYKKLTNEYFSTGKIVVSDSSNFAPAELLEFTTHEVNHAVNSVVKGIVPIGNSFVTRMGIYSKDFRDRSRKNKNLEEAINVLQTAEIMDHILEFTNYNVSDSEIRYTLDGLRYAAGTKREGLGYTLTTPIIRPLYEDNYFNKMLKDKRMDGNVSVISREFDSKAGQGAFSALASCCDDIYSPKTSNSNYYADKVKAETIVRQYVKR